MLDNYWYIVAKEGEVRKKPKNVLLFGRPLAVFRTGPDMYAALEDRCAHRNAPLSAGKTCGQTIQCPYHGWKYNGDGTLHSIPSLEAGSCPKISIPSYPCVAQDGYLWVCLGQRLTSDKPPFFPHLGESGWTSFKMHTRFEAPVEQCLENFLDCPHAAYVHQSWFRSPTGHKVKVCVRTTADGAEAEYFNEPREKSLVWKWLQDSDTAMRHTDRFIAPSTSRVDYIFSDHKHYIVTSSCTPTEKNLTDVYTIITFRYGTIGWLIRLFFEPLSRIIIKQDVDIMGKQRRNIERFGEERFCHSPADFLLPHILRWRREIAEGKEPNFEENEKTVEIVL